jgi:hypothetical protein
VQAGWGFSPVDPPVFERLLRGPSTAAHSEFHKATAGPSDGGPADAIYAVASEDGEGGDGDDDRESSSAAEFSNNPNIGKQGLRRKRRPRNRSKKINSRSKSFVSNGVDEGEHADPMWSPEDTDGGETESSCKLPDNHADPMLGNVVQGTSDDYEGDSHLSWRSTTNSETQIDVNSDAYVGNGFEHIYVAESQVQAH